MLNGDPADSFVEVVLERWPLMRATVSISVSEPVLLPAARRAAFAKSGPRLPSLAAGVGSRRFAAIASGSPAPFAL